MLDLLVLCSIPLAAYTFQCIGVALLSVAKVKCCCLDRPVLVMPEDREGGEQGKATSTAILLRLASCGAD